MKKALITGIVGQDGSYLAELLLEKDYEVHGTERPLNGKDNGRLWRISDIIDKVRLHDCDVTNSAQVESVFLSVMPDEVYHLASKVQPRLIFEEEKNIFENHPKIAKELKKKLFQWIETTTSTSKECSSQPNAGINPLQQR